MIRTHKGGSNPAQNYTKERYNHMIRILPASYDKNDLEILQDLFNEMANTMQAVYCQQTDLPHM